MLEGTGREEGSEGEADGGGDGGAVPALVRGPEVADERVADEPGAVERDAGVLRVLDAGPAADVGGRGPWLAAPVLAPTPLVLWGVERCAWEER